MTARNDPAPSWRCKICAYVHTGANAPDVCPLCGAPASEFERADAAPVGKAASAQNAAQWLCTVCGYVHSGAEPPETCVVCAAVRGDFQPLEKPAPISRTSGLRIVIVGAGAAGMAAAEAARAASPEAEIVLLSKETEAPYYRLNLTRYLAGEIKPDALPLRPSAWYAAQRVDLRLNAAVARLHLAERVAELADGRRERFDRLILTAGAHPFVPPLPGVEKRNVFTLRTREDAERILAAAKKGARCLCVGGGLLGLETAGALARRGADVLILESHSYLMPNQLDARAGALLAEHAAAAGVALRTNARLRELRGGEAVAEAVLTDGAVLPAEAVVLAVGVRSDTHLAREAGLDVRRGVTADNRLRTTHPDVFVAGDVAEHAGRLYGNWFVAHKQGEIAGRNAAGGDAEFLGLPCSHTLKVLDIGVTGIGRFSPVDGADWAVSAETSGGGYHSFVFRDGLMVGANLLGHDDLAAAVKRAIETRKDFSALLRQAPSAADVAAYLREQT